MQFERESYRSHFPFRDPDGNTWLVQEVTSRLPGRIGPGPTAFTSADDLARTTPGDPPPSPDCTPSGRATARTFPSAMALRRAAAAHAERPGSTGDADTDWAEWYAAYLVAEQTGGGAS
ncbi:hypothetical protein SHL15_8071 [Streptomyces hygroscopicus subsp. limoneus]|nr:hypothetical protein SHL15_8071 [Streptomyces hygroscopicus subsp. limoneus]